jgi:tetratricopeptide (TPR) repeat protein
MSHRIVRSLAAPLAFTLIAPLCASAQISTYYSPPKVLKQGSASAPIVGSGSVRVQVMVKPDGSIGTVLIKSSTNHGDDAAALQIARTSTYKAGARDAKPILAFYTMVLKFDGTSLVNDTGSKSSDVLAANALVRAGKYAEAKQMLQSYLGGHPGDERAEALLGVAESFLKEPVDAANAFGAAGTVPDNFKNVEIQAFNEAAEASLQAKNYDAAIGYATKSDSLLHSVNATYTRGVAETNAQQYPKGIADLEAARDLAAGKADAATQNSILSSLTAAYFLGGDGEKGLASLAMLRKRDAAEAGKLDPIVGNYYGNKANAESKTNPTDAIAMYEAGAQAVPSQAGPMLGQASVLLANSAKTPDDWKRVHAEASKALAVDPNNPTTNYIDGVALASTGDKAGATAALQKAKANVGSNAQLSAQIDKALSQTK